MRLAIRKVMYAPMKQGDQPSVEVSKEFMMSPNKLHLEASLDKEVIFSPFDIEICDGVGSGCDNDGSYHKNY